MMQCNLQSLHWRVALACDGGAIGFHQDSFDATKIFCDSNILVFVTFHLQSARWPGFLVLGQAWGTAAMSCGTLSQFRAA